MLLRLCVSKTCRAALLAALLPLILIGPSAVAHAQASAAAITGAVLDPEGKAVVDAGIIVRNEATGDIRTTTTDGRGHFSVADLRGGLYTVEVGVPGFDIVRKAGLQLAEGTPADTVIQLSIANIAETVTVSTALPAAAVAAPSQASLTARSAESLISNEYVRNYTSPFSDYSQVLQMAPGTFSVSANGPGLSDTKTYYRGFKDGYYSMTFDGIPFNDTNDPTHHSWVFFPAQTIGSTVFERSPGSASSIGPSTYGGAVNLLSQSLPTQQQIAGTVSYGSFNTRLFDAQFDSGAFGGGKSRLMIEGHELRSDGYQTFNDLKTDAFSAKYQFTPNDHTVLTAFSSIEDMHSNTPNQKGSTRAQIAQFGDNFLMTADPASPLYFGYNFYNVPTHFEYVGLKTAVGNWSFDNKTYTMRYHNQQNYNSTTAISTTSAVDKLNAYWKVGDYLPISYVSPIGIFTTGVWAEYASSDRHQTPSDPRTWVDAAIPNFHETFGTTSLQPFAEFGFKVTSQLSVTPGIKLAYYKQDFTQFADSKIVGNLNGAASVSQTVEYHAWLPSVDAHYMILPSWSVYGQYGKGQNIPPTSIFDVTGAQVATLPQPILSDTFQVGSVWKSRRATLDVDVYDIKIQNDYSSSFDNTLGETLYFASGTSVSKGVESESTILLGGGLALYMNGTVGSAKYTDTGLRVQNAPSDTETLGLTFNQGSWNLGFFSKRIGKMFNDNGAVNEAIPIDPFNVTNMFLNYTLHGSSMLGQSKLRFAVNNLTDSHAITAVSPASKTSNVPAAGDVLTLMSGRSVSVSMTVGVGRKP